MIWPSTECGLAHRPALNRLEYHWQPTTMLMSLNWDMSVMRLQGFGGGCSPLHFAPLVDSTMMVLPSTMVEHRCRWFDGANRLLFLYIGPYTNIGAN